jgi:hypothetical protein
MGLARPQRSYHECMDRCHNCHVSGVTWGVGENPRLVSFMGFSSFSIFIVNSKLKINNV